jgi:hypothetical protein
MECTNWSKCRPSGSLKRGRWSSSRRVRRRRVPSVRAVGGLRSGWQSRYVRTLRDLSACGRAVVLRLRVRHFACRALGCPRRTFSEQVDGATAPHRRATVRPEAVLSAICAALGGEAGS